MGTRSHIRIINNVGEKKVNKYNQWDGHFDSLGRDILMFLHVCDLNKLNDAVNKLQTCTYYEGDCNYRFNGAYQSRDISWKYLHLIYGSIVTHTTIDKEDSYSWDEYDYEINLQSNTFTMRHLCGEKEEHHFKLDSLPSLENFDKLIGVTNDFELIIPGKEKYVVLSKNMKVPSEIENLIFDYLALKHQDIEEQLKIQAEGEWRDPEKKRLKTYKVYSPFVLNKQLSALTLINIICQLS